MALHPEDMSDTALLAEVGERVRRERLNQNLTQEELARTAGIGRIVLTRIEGGKGATLRSLLKILRALGKISQIDAFLPEPGVSPVQLAASEGHERREATGRRGRPRTRRT